MAKRRRKIERAKRRTGLAAIPLDKFSKCRYYFYEEIEAKDKSKIIKDYIKSNVAKKDSKIILSLPDDFFRASDVAATVFWYNSDMAKTQDFLDAWEYFINEYLPGKKQYALNRESHISQVVIKEPSSVVPISPAQRVAEKVDREVITHIDYMIDDWINGNETEIDVYNLCISNGIKGGATKQIKDYILSYKDELEGALNNTDPELVENYNHVDKKEKKRRINVFQNMLNDLERIKNTTVMQRRARKQTSKSADKQVSKIQYKNADSDFKLQSINPVLIVGSKRLYAFNTKTKVLKKLIAMDVGFEISGSTIKNFNPVESLEIALRKPDEVLQIVLGRADKTIDEAIGNLTTKPRVANGRINKDTILLRAT
jgi:hypothetical protein